MNTLSNVRSPRHHSHSTFPSKHGLASVNTKVLYHSLNRCVCTFASNGGANGGKDGDSLRSEEEEAKRSFGQAFGDEVKNFFDFANWAPRSSQAWRLGGLDTSTNGSSKADSSGSMSEEDVEVLNERLARQRQSISGSMYEEEDEGDNTAVGNHGEEYEEEKEQPSFLRSTDEEFASSLNARITEVASSMDAEETEEYLGLSGETLIELIRAKYGKKHDVAFVRRDIPGKTLVSLNIYHAYLGQKSFPMSAEDFSEKMDAVALSLEMWDQVETVVAFLKSPVTPRRGLPSRPIVGNAVSISLELTKEQITEWFGR
jgi:hypothetical protein